MKKVLLLAAVLFTALLNAQSFQVTELSGGAAAQSHYVFNTDLSNVNSPSELIEFKIKNVSGSSKLAKIRKNIISNASGQDVYFCYNQTCFTPYTYTAVATIAAGAALPNGSGTSYGLRAEFDHNNVVGTSIVRYTIYDSLNVTDSMNITITYNVSNVNGIKSNNSVTVSQASPNPASSLVNFSYEFANPAADAQVKIYNSLGTLVKTVVLNPADKKAQADVSSLEEGYYFYSIVSDGKVMSTRKLIIAR
jgi:hypothetical protein